MLLKVALLAFLVLGCWGNPDPQADKGLGSALNAAGAPQDKFTCECRPTPSNDGVRTLQCHCVTKGTEGSPNVDPGTNTNPNAGGPGSGTGGGGGAASGGSEEAFFGDTTSYVACLKRGPGAANTVKPDWDWLKSDGKSVEVPGKWIKTNCIGGVQHTFQVQASAYKNVLDACKKNGYDVAQPANFGVSSYYAFQVGSTVQEHFNRNPGIISTTYDRLKEDVVAKCSAVSQGADTNSAATQFGDTGTYIVCVKRGTGFVTSRPDWDWLKVADGKYAVVPGKWVSFSCSYGRVQSFNVREEDYKRVNDQCKARGYELAQPSTTTFGGWYAFQIGADVTEYYSEEKGWIKNGYTRRPRVGSEKC